MQFYHEKIFNHCKSSKLSMKDFVLSKITSILILNLLLKFRMILNDIRQQFEQFKRLFQSYFNTKQLVWWCYWTVNGYNNEDKFMKKVITYQIFEILFLIIFWFPCIKIDDLYPELFKNINTYSNLDCKF